MNLIDFWEHKHVANVRSVFFILENDDYFSVIGKTIILVSKIQSTEFITRKAISSSLLIVRHFFHYWREIICVWRAFMLRRWHFFDVCVYIKVACREM